jgi:geranylgeranyl pyrophosphate synthase
LRSKTGSLIGLSAESGAIAGGATDDQIRLLGEFGETTGIAFQIVDDVLNVTGNVKEYGKEIGGDIREGKKTILAAHLLDTANAADKTLFLRLLGKNTISATEIKRVIRLYDKYGCVVYAKAQADVYLTKAMSALDVFTDSNAKKSLANVARFLVTRNF